MDTVTLKKYGITMSMEKEVVEENFSKLVPAAYRLAAEYQTVADSVGKGTIDDTELNKIKQHHISTMETEVRDEHMDKVADFRNYLIQSVRTNRTDIFFIRQMTSEIIDLIEQVEELVTKEVLPQKKSADREVKVAKAFALYDEYFQVSELVENFTIFYAMYGSVDKIKYNKWELEEEDEFRVSTKTLKDGSIKFKMPKPHSPTSRFGEAKKTDGVMTLQLMITKIDDEELNITVAEFIVLYLSAWVTDKVVYESTARKEMDTRKSGDTITFKATDGTKHKVTWVKSEI